VPLSMGLRAHAPNSHPDLLRNGLRERGTGSPTTYRSSEELFPSNCRATISS
jgi:hypothetical protein